jgi:uncharacterized glyoxalase superfamily protein PhnB
MTIPKQYNQLMPYLVVRTGPEFLAFAREVFGATEQLTVPRPDGSVMHGELRIGEAVIMYCDANEDYRPVANGLCLLVESADDVYKKALANGCFSLREPEDQEYGRGAGFQDQFGNTWWLMEGIK